jgi:hypothetical protein
MEARTNTGKESPYMQTNRCGHFSLETEILPVLHTAVVLRVPIRRCALAEQMIAVISQNEEGWAVARKLTIATSNLENSDSEDAAPPKLRVAFGPDLEAIHSAECTVERCQQSCTPGYRLMLRQFGQFEEAERETGEGCQEIIENASDLFAQG